MYVTRSISVLRQDRSTKAERAPQETAETFPIPERSRTEILSASVKDCFGEKHE